MKKSLTVGICLTFLSSSFYLWGNNENTSPLAEPEPIKALSPQDSLATMVVQDGFQMSLVAHEPIVEEPVLMSFDSNGRIYVAEMLTYMLDVDGTGQFEARSRIKRLEDTNGDGEIDKATTFAEGLLLPRMILPLLDGQILVRETNTFDLLLLEDTNGDGVADKRSTFYEGGPRGGNLEHQPSGLIWGIDNWLYVTITNKRYRIKDGKLIAQPIAFGGGQWGLGQDAAGRFFYSSAGGERPAGTFQFPSVYGNFQVDDEIADGFNEVFPIETVPDVQGGLLRLREDGSLNHFTGVAGQSIYLGDTLPELYGHYILPEPVGNLIRLADVKRQNGYTQLSHRYQADQKEFIASTDSAFRPVWTETGPDGALYIVDMYRGIIQEGNWTPKGSFLRDVIDQFELDKIIGRGRIYRVDKPGAPRGATPDLYQRSPQDLIHYLGHPNQWWRLQAQKLLVLQQSTEVIPQLKRMAKKDKRPLARLHALWTLEGLGVVDKKLLKRAVKDKNSDVRTAAVRLSEQLYQHGDSAIALWWQALIKKADLELAQQLFLSAYYVDAANKADIRDAVLEAFGSSKSVAAVDKILQYQIKEREKQQKLASQNQALASAVKQGKQHFDSLCASCHGPDGSGMKVGDNLLAPSFHNNARLSGDVATLARIGLHGLTGPIEGDTFIGGNMASIASNGDRWVADVLTYIRNDFGNEGSVISTEQIHTIRELEPRTSAWTIEELDTRYGASLSDKSQWQLSSNASQEGFQHALDGKSDWAYWNSQAIQKPGLWLQVALPQVHRLSQIQLDCDLPRWRCARSYEVSISTDGDSWLTLENNIESGGVRTTEALGHNAKYIRFTLTNGTTDQPWAVSEINLFGSPVTP